MSRPGTDSNEAAISPSEFGALRSDIMRVGRELRDQMADMRADLRGAVAELRTAIDDRRDEITKLQVDFAKVPDEKRVAALEAKVELHGQELAKLGVKLALAGTVLIAALEAGIHYLK